MNLKDIIITIFEVALVVFTLWALFNEDKLIAFESKIKAAVCRRRLKVLKSKRVQGIYCTDNH